MVIGVLYCAYYTIDYIRASNKIVFQGLATKSEKTWDKPTLFRKGTPHPESTHQAGPFQLSPEGAPYSFEYEIMDGGQKDYRFRFSLYAESRFLIWSHFGSSVAKTGSDESQDLTLLKLPSVRTAFNDRFMVIASVLDSNGQPARSPARLVIRQRVPDPSMSVFWDLMSRRLFLLGAFVAFAGAATFASTFTRPVLNSGPSDRPHGPASV